MGPRDKAVRWSCYTINGVKYHTVYREMKRKTQNSGVMINAKTNSYASAKDRNPREEDVTHYGKVKDIVELYYFPNRKLKVLYYSKEFGTKDNITYDDQRWNEGDVRYILLRSVGKKWSDWKIYLKKNYYISYQCDALRVENRSDRVKIKQWRSLVYYWGTREA